jgi:predicted nucleotide-binding protein
MPAPTVRPEYKRLYGRTLKLGIERYLITQRFQDLLIEHGADELFESALQIVHQNSSVAILSAQYTGYHRDALGLFIEFGFEQEPFLQTYVAMLVDFADWAASRGESPPNFSGVVEALIGLGVDPEVLSPVATSAQRVQPTAPAIRPSASNSKDAPPVPTRPRLFIGSSKEGLAVAEALHANLDHDYECTIWTQGVFGLSLASIEALELQLHQSDFAVLVVTPDDTTESRGSAAASPRDNVVFELGLFMGALGRLRTFVLRPRTAAIKIPSDLFGVTMATYDEGRSDGNLRAATGAACAEIKQAVARALKRAG